jgi:hypothetical protein
VLGQLASASCWLCINVSGALKQWFCIYTQADIEKGTIYGTWQADAFIVGPDSSGEFCHINEIK